MADRKRTIKLDAQDQGKVIAEYSAVWGLTKQNRVQVGEEWYVMFPDGAVMVLKTKRSVEQAAKKFFKRHVKKGRAGIGRIEWRT